MQMLETILVVTDNLGDLFLVAETALSRRLELQVDEPLFEDELPDGVLLMVETNPDSVGAAISAYLHRGGELGMVQIGRTVEVLCYTV